MTKLVSRGGGAGLTNQAIRNQRQISEELVNFTYSKKLEKIATVMQF